VDGPTFGWPLRDDLMVAAGEFLHGGSVVA
jgi:hypothetical protein